jgi:hypothetical protein
MSDQSSAPLKHILPVKRRFDLVAMADAQSWLLQKCESAVLYPLIMQNQSVPAPGTVCNPARPAFPGLLQYPAVSSNRVHPECNFHALTVKMRWLYCFFALVSRTIASGGQGRPLIIPGILNAAIAAGAHGIIYLQIIFGL